MDNAASASASASNGKRTLARDQQAGCTGKRRASAVARGANSASKGVEAAIVLADWLMAGLCGEHGHDDETRGEMAWVLGSMCAAGLTDRRHVDALLSHMTHDASSALLSGLMRGWELLGDGDVAPVVCEEVVGVVYGHMGAGRTCEDAPMNELARFMEMQRRGSEGAADGTGHGSPVTHARVKEQVEGLVDAVMEDEQGPGVEDTIGAVMAMTLLPPATLVDNLDAACDAVGELDERGGKEAADRLATRIGERLATLPPSYLPDKLDPLINVLKLEEPDEHDGYRLMMVDGAVRILKRLPLHLFDGLADTLVRTMLYSNEWTADACARALTGRAEYTHVRMAARISGVMGEQSDGYERAMVMRDMAGLQHALCVALPREVTVLLSDPLLKFMLDEDVTGRFAHLDMMQGVFARLEPDEVLPYASQLVAHKALDASDPRCYSAPDWRAPLLARLPFTALEGHFTFLARYISNTSRHTYETYILPIYRQFPPSRFGPEVDYWVDKLSHGTYVCLWRETPHDEIIRMPMLRALDLCDGDTLSASTVRTAAALSCVMGYGPDPQEKGWRFYHHLSPGVIPPDFSSLLESLPTRQDLIHGDPPDDTYPLTDDAKDAHNSLRLNLHERVESFKTSEARAKFDAALTSDNAEHRLVVLQFFECLPSFAAGLLLDHMAHMVAARLDDPDTRVRSAALKVLRRVSTAAKAPLAEHLCPRLEDEDQDIRDLTLNILQLIPPDATAPLAKWAIDRLVAAGQPWGVSHALKRFIYKVVENGVGLRAHLQPHVVRLLECAMDESTSVDTSDACMDALSRVPRYLLDDNGAVQKMINGNSRLQPAAIRLVQQWQYRDISVFEEWICSTLSVDDIECRVAVLPMLQRLPELKKVESADRVVDAVVRYHGDPHLVEAVGRVIGASEEGCEAVDHAVRCLLECVALSYLPGRHAALGVLRHLPGAHFTRQQTLLSQRLSSPSRDVRLSTLDLICDRMPHTPLPLLTPPLIRLLRRVEDPRICQAAAKALASRTAECLTPHAEEVVGAFVDAGTIATDALRITEAAQAHPVFVPHLKVLLANDSVDTRRKALVALTHISGQLLAPLKPDLEARLTDTSFSVRDLAVGLLGNVGRGPPYIETLYLRDRTTRFGR